MQVQIEKLVFGGQALGRIGKQVAFIWGALPGETVEFRVIKKKKNFVEGVVTKILVPSPDRIAPTEPHYMACSPWSVITIEKENEWKRQIALDTYFRVGNLKAPENLELVHTGSESGYRNKIEYSFAPKPDNTIGFAFHERGDFHPMLIEQCELAGPAINQTAHKILALLSEQHILVGNLKSLIIRSNQAGETAAALFLKSEHEIVLPQLTKQFVGFQMYYSNPLSPASNPDKLLQSVGQDYLVEKLFDRQFKYGSLSFFQINIPIFTRALDDIKPFLQKEKIIVDYYAGVGAISLSLAGKNQSVNLVENNSEAVRYAQENIVHNGLKNAVTHLLAAEIETEHITSDCTVILDPPRAGLDKKVIGVLLEKLPKQVIYLSCDLATHARDIALLGRSYTPVFWRTYNFFPHTPHIEGLVVLTRR